MGLIYEVAKYTELTGEDGNNVPISRLGGFLDGYDKGIADNEIINDLIELGYPHNFQNEPSYIVDYMYKVTDIVRKAYQIKEQKNDH